ncbi:MAG: glycerophosphodiester phosphodiesterase [Chloroflexi bacterium]|nr:glycerophosphodiester phosphodiesterase [Chloroflexota bacterium]
MRKTLVIAHRGFHRDFPENTIEALKAALDLGADGVEFDLQETADSEFVIHHDDEIGGRSISTLSLAEIAVCRVGGGYCIPTLQEALEVLGRGLVLLVELKKVHSLEKFLAILRRYVDPAWTVLVSFDAALIGRLSGLAPDFTCAVIGEPSAAGGNLPEHNTAGFTRVRCDSVNGALVKEAHARGDLVFAWDGGEEAELRRALSCGIDVIMTDRPDVVIREIRGL